MAAIRSKNTKPEVALRQALRALGHRGYRLHRRDLPGCPDVSFMGHKVAVFVDGAYWHGHPDHWHPERASEYWQVKISRNMERDRAADTALATLGWRVIRFWDFEVSADPIGCARDVASLVVGGTVE
jgi:DNA mismatch endonuclease (patch repair protein)